MLSVSHLCSSQSSCAPLWRFPHRVWWRQSFCSEGHEAKWSILRAYCLNLVKKHVEVFVAYTLGGTSKGRQRDDFLNAAFTLGNAQNGRAGMTLSFYRPRQEYVQNNRRSWWTDTRRDTTRWRRNTCIVYCKIKYLQMGVFINGGIQNGWFIVENQKKWW